MPAVHTGQIYTSASNRHHPVDGPVRIMVTADPVTTPGLYGYGKTTIVTLTRDGRQIRQRRIATGQLHASAADNNGQPRRTGYILENPS